MQFAEFTREVPGKKVVAHLKKLPTVGPISVVTNGVTDLYIRFEWRGHSFTITVPFGEWEFAVRDPECPEEILEALVAHCERVLGPPTRFRRLTLAEMREQARPHSRDETAGNSLDRRAGAR